MTRRALGAAVLLAGLAACNKPKPLHPEQGNSSQPMVDMRLNPVVNDLMVAACTHDDAGDVQSADSVPGYNDAQKLAESETSTAYGPEVRIYSCPSKRTTIQFQDGTFIALIQVIGSSQTASYVNLDLTYNAPAFYCLYVKSAVGTWQAGVSRITGDHCEPPSSFPLQVVRTDVSAQDGYYPPTIRIVDPEGELPRIGFPCATAWCEAGRNAQTYTNPSAGGGTAQERVKGWHDEQRIADPDAANPGKMKRGMRAEIIPVDGLAKLARDDFRATRPHGTDIIGQKVAIAWLSGPPTGAYSTWGLSNGRTNLWMRLVQMNGVDTLQAQFARGEPDAAGPWFFVKHAAHKIKNIPGVARWIWDATDETIWLACDQGCCEVTQDPALMKSPAPVAPGGKGSKTGNH